MSDDHPSPTAKAVSRSYRNTLSVIVSADQNLAAAEQEGVMALYADPDKDRSVLLQTVRQKRQVIDFVRCSYLGLDNHPLILEGAIEAVQRYKALHWSCARTRLNFSLFRRTGRSALRFVCGTSHDLHDGSRR